jgi:hypothetical protein
MIKRLFLAAVLVTTPALLTSVVAQDHGPPAGGSDKNLRDSSSDLKGRSNEIERVSRDAKKTDNRGRVAEKPESRPAPNFAEVKEDFERIQTINSDVLQASTSKPDYGRISESAADIGKRAIRLKSNLFPPKSTKKSKEDEPRAEDQDLKSLLTLLDNSIGSFTQNPMFTNTRVVNSEDTTNAEKELDSVIKISARIRNEADRLKKATSTPE